MLYQEYKGEEMKLDDELKAAISQLPSKEKDKLLFRLIKKDYILANRLYFELVSVDSVQDRRMEMEKRVEKQIVKTKSSSMSHAPAYLLKTLRSTSADITEHVKITKDKYGEASLNLLMLNEMLSKNNDVLAKATPKNSYKLNIYIVVRAFKILILIKALHEDFIIEFEDGLKELSENFGNNPNLMDLALHNGFDPNWLFHARIPDDIEKVHKELRDNGFLK